MNLFIYAVMSRQDEELKLLHSVPFLVLAKDKDNAIAKATLEAQSLIEDGGTEDFEIQVRPF
jgi:hypothetical protein